MSARESSLPDPRHASAEELLAHAVWLRRLARSLVADAATADDLVQDAWIAAMRKPPSGDQPIAPWLARVVQNLAHSRRRGEQRRTARETARFVDRHEPGADETAGSLEMQRLLIDAVESLDEPLRSTLVRHYFHAKTSVEIAREDGVADGTVRWRLKQAVDELRRRLDAHHGGDRRAWSVVLLPLARRADVAAPTASVAATAAVGVIVMSTWLKVVAAVVLVALAVGGWMLTRPAGPVAPPIVAASTPTAPQELGKPVIAAPAVGVPVREALPAPVASTTQASTASVPAAKPDYTAFIEARVVDTAGVPLAGALVTCIDNVGRDGSGRDVAPKTKCVDDGRMRIALKKSDASRHRGRSAVAAPDTWLMELEFAAPGKATLSKDVNVQADKTFALGDIVLGDGGDIAGRVVDEHGNALADADVRLILSDLTLEERDAVATKGIDGKDWKAWTKSDAKGSFTLPSVPIGLYRVWGQLKGRLSAVSDPFTVQTAQTSTVPDIVLPENTRAIRGVVLGLDGSPQKRAEVDYTFQDGGREFWLPADANDKGEFLIDRVESPAVDLYSIGPWIKGDDIAANDPKDRGQAFLREVKAGTHDLVLQLRPTTMTHVVVKDTDGVVVTDPISIGLFDMAGSGQRSGLAAAVHNIRLLEKPCQLVIGGVGFTEKTVGPFGLGNTPENIEVVLERSAKITGRVTLDGKPFGQAFVGADRVLPPGSEQTRNGFLLRLDNKGDVFARTDQGGHFAFSVDKDGQYVIVASAKGCAEWESEPLELGPMHGKDGVEIALGHGGSVEGRVTSISTSDAEPAYVTLSNGSGRDASARVQSDGTYRHDNLTPGTWMVRMTREDWSDGGRYLDHVPPDPAARDVRIVEGEAAHLDLDAREFTSPKVAGVVTIQGFDATKWTATLSSKGSERDQGPSAALDANGRFLLVADETGPHRLKLASSISADRTDAIADEVDLGHRTLDWTFEVATGSVKLPASTSGEVVLTWTSPNGSTWSSHVKKVRGTELVIDRVPVGTVLVQAEGHARMEAPVRIGEATAVQDF
jgi:RNA polymerase sigma-70 factor (ECF subfamily)